MRNWIAAALILVLGLSLTACGNDNAGTTANRWNDAAQQQANARGPIGDQSDGTYHADEHGQVDGFDTHSADGEADSAEENLKQAGDDLGDAAKNAGEAAKDAAEGAGDAVRDAGEAAKDAAKGVGEAVRDAGEAAKDAAKGVGEAAEDALDGRNDTTQKAQNDAKTAKEQAN